MKVAAIVQPEEKAHPPCVPTMVPLVVPFPVGDRLAQGLLQIVHEHLVVLNDVDPREVEAKKGRTDTLLRLYTDGVFPESLRAALNLDCMQLEHMVGEQTAGMDRSQIVLYVTSILMKLLLKVASAIIPSSCST